MVYKDPNYDPKAAHEYYMRHRKLKGRHSTRHMSNSQKEQWYYAKAQLKEQKKIRDAKDKITIYANRDEAIKSATESKKRRLEQIKEQKEQQKKAITEQAKQKIDSLRNKLKNMTPEQRKLAREKISETIDGIRSAMSSKKKNVTDMASAKSKSIRTATTAENKNTRKKASEILKSAREFSKDEYEAAVDEAYNKIKGGK